MQHTQSCSRWLNIRVMLDAFLCGQIARMSYLRLNLLIVLYFLPQLPLSAQPDMGLILHKEPNSYFQRLFGDSSFMVLKNSLDDAIKKKDKLAAAICLKKMGNISYHLTYFPQALDYHLQAGKLLKELGQTQLQAENLNDIGVIFMQCKQAAAARQHFDEAFEMYKQLKDGIGMATTHGRIGHLYTLQHQPDSGLYYMRLSLHEYTSLGNKPGVARIYGQIGNIYEDLGKYDSAYRYFQQSQILSEQTRDTASCIEALNNMGDIFRKTGRYEQALPLTRSALELALRTNEMFHLGSAYRDMAKTHHLLHNDDSAYYFQRIGQALVQDIFRRENSTQLAVLKTMYDVEKKNSEIDRLKAARRSQVTFVVIGVLLLLLGALIISRQRMRIRHARLLNKQEKDAYQAKQSLMELQQQALRQELELKSRELSTHTLNIIQKNQFLEKLLKQVDEMLKDDKRDQRKPLKHLQVQISQSINHGQHWDEFHGIFDQVHDAFFAKLKTYSDSLTRADLRLVALLKMNLASAETATLLGVSQDSLRVMRYRLRKKLNLVQGESLSQFIQSI